MAKYKVLSVRQPYASLLVNGEKDVENRSRKTNYRGTVLIHASAVPHEVIQKLSNYIHNGVPLVGIEKDIMHYYDTEVESKNLFSAIIGSVDIVDCADPKESCILSEWSEAGMFHWKVANAKVFKHPIRNIKGKLGIWDWDGEIEDAG